VTPAVDHDELVFLRPGWNLVRPVVPVRESSVQEEDRVTGAVGDVTDVDTVDMGRAHRAPRRHRLERRLGRHDRSGARGTLGEHAGRREEDRREGRKDSCGHYGTGSHVGTP